jgi:hypothetical protein
MKDSDYNRILTDLEIIARDNKIVATKLMRVKDTQFEPNITETNRIKSKVQTIRKKMAELTTEF